MPSVAKAEIERGEPNGRKACIDFSLRNFKPGLYALMAEEQGLEARYLGKESSIDRNTGKLIIPSVINNIRGIVSGLSQRNGLSVLTDDELRDRREEAHKKQQHTGLEIKEKAEELGLVTVQTEDQVNSMLDQSGSRLFTYEVNRKDGHGYLQSRGWNMYRTENGAFVLITRSAGEGDVQQFDTTSVDALFDQDPDFVADKIRSFYESQGVEHVVNSIAYNLALHEVDSSTLIPQFFDLLSTDAQTREKEIDGLITFLYAFGRIGEYPNKLVNQFTTNLKRRTQQILDGKQETTSRDYVDHLITCPGESEQGRTQAFLRFGLMEAFAGIEFDKLERPNWEDNSPEAQQTRLLMHPLSHTQRVIEKERIRIQSEKERDSQFVRVIQATRQITDMGEFEQALARDLPDAFSSIERIKEVGPTFAGKTAFDRFIDRATAMVVRDGRELNQAVMESLEAMHLPHDSVPGILFDWRRGVRFTNPELQFLLSLIVLKSVQATNPDSIGERLSSMVTSYEKKITSADTRLVQLNQEEELMKAVLAQYGISEEIVDRLAVSVEPEDTQTDRPNHTAFTLAFLALLFSEHLDRTSPAFRAMVKEIYPSVKDETLDILQESV